MKPRDFRNRVKYLMGLLETYNSSLAKKKKKIMVTLSSKSVLQCYAKHYKFSVKFIGKKMERKFLLF